MTSVCKSFVVCTLRPDGTAKMCDEYENMDSAPEFDWDLRELEKLIDRTEAENVE